MPAGTRTAPTFAAGTENMTNTTLHLIDASGDVFTDTLLTTTAPTVAEVEAYAAAYQAASQASLWKISQSLAWVGDADPDNADTGQRDSIADGINMSYKNLTTLKTQGERLIAPIAAVMQGNQDIPLVSSTELAALITAVLAVLDGYNLQSAQFTERRERKNNAKIKV